MVWPFLSAESKQMVKAAKYGLTDLSGNKDGLCICQKCSYENGWDVDILMEFDNKF